MINGPINKTKTLNKKYLGITEYVAKNFNQKKFAMLIYNKKLSVCPVTTHLPLKLVAKKITKDKIKEKIIIVDNFYKKFLGIKPRIAVIGLNPHCESILEFNEDTEIIRPLIRSFKNKINRVWVHTCTLDHKNALKNYITRGMKIFKTEVINI